MKSRYYVITLTTALAMALALLSGCATNGNGKGYGQVDRITPEQMAKILPPPVATVPLSELVADSKAGKTTDDIIAKIKASQSRYELTPTQTLDLNKQGVDRKVLDYMYQSNELAKQNAIADELNKREQAKRVAQKQLQYERAYRRNEFFDQYWWSQGYGRYGLGYRNGFGSRFGWGYGYPYGNW